MLNSHLKRLILRHFLLPRAPSVPMIACKLDCFAYSVSFAMFDFLPMVRARAHFNGLITFPKSAILITWHGPCFWGSRLEGARRKRNKLRDIAQCGKQNAV